MYGAIAPLPLKWPHFALLQGPKNGTRPQNIVFTGLQSTIRLLEMMKGRSCRKAKQEHLAEDWELVRPINLQWNVQIRRPGE